LIAAVPLVLALAPFGQSPQPTPPACTSTWVGGASDNWADGGNWSPPVVPNGGVVCIPTGANVTHDTTTPAIDVLLHDGTLTLTGGTLTVNDTSNDSHIASLVQSAGTLGGASTILLTGSSTWSGGTMSGPGTTRLASGAMLSLTGSSGRVLSNRTLDVRGTANWSAGSIQQVGSASTFVGPGGLIDVVATSVALQGQGTLEVAAGGTLRKSAGGGVTTAASAGGGGATLTA